MLVLQPTRAPAARAAAALLLLAFGSACATYSDRTEQARLEVTSGNYPGAVAQFDKFLGTKDDQELPDEYGSDTALGLLERGALHQAQEAWKRGARDLGAADKELELLDLSSDPVGTLGKYVYSDSSPKYRASATEKLALNSFNMLNYLAAGDLPGARVEARRYTVMRDYLKDLEGEKPAVAIGPYLAGFVFDHLGEPEVAMRYYDEALAHARFESLREPVARLAPRALHRGENIQGFLDQEAAATQPAPANSAEILTVVSVRRVPFKVPRRIPIGAAVGMAGSWISGNPDVLGYSVFKVVTFPDLEPAPGVFKTIAVKLDGEPTRLELASDLEVEIRREFNAMKPKILGAALSRMIVRAAAAEGMRQAGNQQSSGLGWALALLTEAALVALDKPDTRSWSLLPAKVYVTRSRVPAGQHTVEVALGGGAQETRSFDLDLKPGGFATVVVTTLR